MTTHKPAPSDPNANPFVDIHAEPLAKNAEVLAAYDAKHKKPAPANPGEWQNPGSVESYEQITSGLLLRCTHADVQLIWLRSDVVQVRVSPAKSGFAERFSYSIAKTDYEPVALDISEDKEAPTALYIETSTHIYTITHDNFGLSVDTRDSWSIYEEYTGASWRTGDSDAVRLHLQLSEDQHEAVYGTGERAFNLNLRGRKLGLWNTDAGAYERGMDPINYTVPFLVSVHNYGAYGVLWDNTFRGIIDIGATEPASLIFESEGGDICYYVFAADTVETLLSRYTELTGRMPLPPLWTLGYHQCRYSYETQAEVLQVANELRQRNIPCDAIYLDIHYMDDYRVFTWDHERFPDPAGMIQQIHAMDLKIVPILDPGVKVDPGYATYDSGIERNVFMAFPDGKPATGVVWPGLTHHPDFTDPQARAWWGEQCQTLTAIGADGLWLDMNEPVYFDPLRRPPDYVQHNFEGREGGAKHTEAHNPYGTLMGRATREALQAAYPERRPFTFIRAGWAGAQRYASSWTGDIESTWDALRTSVSLMLNMALSGQSFTGPDLGGFQGDATPELLVRWMQACVLMPFYRNHSAYGSIRQEPYAFGDEIEAILRDTVNLRYRLLPYLYTAFAECSYHGTPIIKPLFTAELDNPGLRDIDDCYMVGDHVLVAPILNLHTLRRTLYLPRGDWYDFHTNRRYRGGRLLQVDAPLNRVPIFVRAGTALPMWPVVQNLSQLPQTMTVRIYPGNATTRIYEDAGEGLAYQAGDYRWVTIACKQFGKEIELERSVEGNYKPPYLTQYEVVRTNGETKSISL